ncbi:hypothetical protein GOP47_0016064 [Adiantum capillus-veneris]|uniref:DYW domain-containing protein n=1 Tax=Adiantum capillus-veneris TaxID=13818 RepID=A0A9D4UKT9_ADICA|nr:hypothetical protein GOP47_0016064 [Adiantum capillus-veneris]
MWANTCILSSVSSVLEQGRSCGRGQEIAFAKYGDQLSPLCNCASVCNLQSYGAPQLESLNLDMNERYRFANDVDWAVQLSNGSYATSQDASFPTELVVENLASVALHISGDLPSIEEVTCLLQRCRKKKNLVYAKQAHTSVCFCGLDIVDYVENHLVPMFVDCGCTSNAHQVFHRSTFKSEHSWTALMFGFVSSGHISLVFDLYAGMIESGMLPSTHTVLALLKACIESSDVQKGQQVHIEAVEWGLEADVSVNSSLVDMYAKSGFLLEASYVLSALPVRNVVSWTALIGGYAEQGLGEEALAEFGKMQLEGVSPNAVTIACLLKAWDSVATKDNIGDFVQKVKGTDCEKDPLVGNTLVGINAKLGFKQDALRIFDRVKNKDVVSWNALISGLVEYGDAMEALIHYEKMPQDLVSPNAVTFTCICKACGSLGDVEQALLVHSEIIKLGLEEDSFLGNSVSCMYAKCDSLLEAVEVFDKLLVKNVVSWSALIGGYAKHGPRSEALKYFEQMKLEGVPPGAFTFTSVLRSFVCMEALNSGRDIHIEIELKGFAVNIHVGNALIGMYTKCGSLLEAEYVFNQLPFRDILSWNTLITGFAEHGLGQEALKYYEEMQVRGFQLDEVSVSGALKACGAIGALGRGREIHASLTEGLFAVDTCVGTSLINMYAKCGSLSEAQEVFCKLPVRNVMVWSTMIQAFGMNHEGWKAIECFEEMQKQGVEANGVTFTCLLSACRHASLPLEGNKYFKAMRQDFGIVPSVEHYNCMIDLFARSGHLFEAEKLCELVGVSAEGALSALLTASRICGETELGLRCFQENVKINVNDAGLYVLMMDIFASAGRLNDASRIEDLRRHVGAFKKPASAVIEIGNEVYEFVVGNNQSKDIAEALRSLNTGMKVEGNVAHLESVLASSSDVEKEASLCEHAEKIALAFGLLHTPQGQTLRVTKNLRMCRDCHNTSMFISQQRKREIVIRDNCCVHHFKDGFCSCGDMF